MPLDLACISHQRPIGQGGFYSATLQLNGQDAYTFVYDCGSLTDPTRLSSEIAEFGSELGHRSLDLLVLSHLDADHVNGVDELLRTTRGVKDVFLPYLSPLERMIYLARYPRQPESYYDLLVDPVATLRSLGAENVYLVGESDEGEEGDDLEQGDPGLSGLRELQLDTKRLRQDEKISDAHAKESGSSAAAAAKGVTDAGPITLSGFWKLRMFQKQGLRAVLEKVLAAGNYAVAPAGESKDERRCRELLREMEKVLAGNPVTNQNILNAMRTEAGRKALRSAYGQVASVHNEVSLCLWHGPAFRNPVASGQYVSGTSALGSILGQSWFRRYSRFRRHWDGHSKGRAGCMLTGDLALKGTTLTKFKRHYARELPWTWLLQIPHHGSRHNLEFDGELFGDLRRLGFTSAGLRNSYLHPHLDVVERLEWEFDFSVLWSHERQGVSFTIEFQTT